MAQSSPSTGAARLSEGQLPRAIENRSVQPIKGQDAMASLQERLDEFKKSFESGAPPYNAPREVIETMHRATAELKATEIEERALKVGDRSPSFTLFNQDHVQVASVDLLREGPVVISFFRGHW